MPDMRFCDTFWRVVLANKAGFLEVTYLYVTTRCRSRIRYDLGLLLQVKCHFHSFCMLSKYMLKLIMGGLREENTPTPKVFFNLCVGNTWITTSRDANSGCEFKQCRIVAASVSVLMCSCLHPPCHPLNLFYLVTSTICPQRK